MVCARLAKMLVAVKVIKADHIKPYQLYIGEDTSYAYHNFLQISLVCMWFWIELMHSLALR